ncbi:MAG: hypothetical protein KGI87_08260 [Burkholderiales bacterium]|nr:hypothetical protein [Burkholderiales bacterium]
MKWVFIQRQITDQDNEVSPAPLRRDFDDSLSGLGLDGREPVGRAVVQVVHVSCSFGVCAAIGSASRLWARSCRLFSSMQITGSRLDSGRVYESSKAYMRCRYSSVKAPMHHITLRQGLRSFF